MDTGDAQGGVRFRKTVSDNHPGGYRRPLEVTLLPSVRPLVEGSSDPLTGGKTPA